MKMIFCSEMMMMNNVEKKEKLSLPLGNVTKARKQQTSIHADGKKRKTDVR